jgi:tRNA(adenine34) deaminase
MNDQEYLKKTFKLADKAKNKGDFPVGAIIVRKGKIIAKSYNKKESKQNAIMHAEIDVISKTCRKLKTWHLEDCTLYTSMEPCTMCVGALNQARIGKVVYSLSNPTFGGIENNKNLLTQKIEIIKLEDEYYKNLVISFFQDKRK